MIHGKRDDFFWSNVFLNQRYGIFSGITDKTNNAKRKKENQPPSFPIFHFNIKVGGGGEGRRRGRGRRGRRKRGRSYCGLQKGKAELVRVLIGKGDRDHSLIAGKVDDEGRKAVG